MLVRGYYSLALEVHVESLQKDTRSIKDKKLQEKIIGFYFPRIGILRERFLSGHSYWKNIHKYYELAAISYLYEKQPVMAIYTINQALTFHPFYLNSYHHLSLIYDRTPFLFAPEKVQKCRQIYMSLVAGDKISLDDVCQCIEIRLCRNK
jgi:hypothetical protein